jgi:hydroxyacylglutathione hydrolase
MKIYKQVFSPIQVNTYALKGKERECIVIDCGCYDSNEEERLEMFFKSRDLKPALLLNTHCHLDHIFGNGFMNRRYGLKSRVDENDLYNLRSATAHALMFGLSMDTPPETGDPVKDGDRIILNEMECEAISVPGHTAGSLAFYFPSAGAVFTGDALFSGSIGRTDLEGGDFETLIKSITTKLFILPDETVVYPGHGPETTIGHEKKRNPFFH